MAKYKLEYIWLDGYTPLASLRSKTTIKEFASFPKLADLPTGDVWISEPGSQAPSGGGNTRAVPAIPPDIVLPDNKDAAPAEFNFNITLMLQRNDKHRVHAGRHRHAAQAAHRSNRLPHNACRG